MICLKKLLPALSLSMVISEACARPLAFTEAKILAANKANAAVITKTNQNDLEWLKQHSHNLNSTDPNDQNYADLAAFGQAVGNARIVALSEQTHGSAQEFDLKVRLVKYLHQIKGFDVLIIESGFYDVGRIVENMQSGAKLSDQAPDNIFFMYSKSLEGKKLLDYINASQNQQRPLFLAGMDSQHSGNLSKSELLKKWRNFYKKYPVSARLNRLVSLQKIVDSLLIHSEPTHTLTLNDDQKAFQRMNEALSENLCSTPNTGSSMTNSSGWWCQVVKNLDASATTLWAKGADYQRDHAMGQNVIWLATQAFAGKK